MLLLLLLPLPHPFIFLLLSPLFKNSKVFITSDIREDCQVTSNLLTKLQHIFLISEIMFLKNLTSKLVFLVAILQINSIFAGPTTKWQRLDTESKEAIRLAQKALNQYVSQMYPGPQQMIVTNISSVEINPDTKEFTVDAKFEESDCLRGNYSATCKILKNGLHSTCHFRGVDNTAEENNFGSLNCQGNAASLLIPTSNLFPNLTEMQDMFAKPISVPNFFPQNGNSNPFYFYNIDEAFWKNSGLQ